MSTEAASSASSKVWLAPTEISLPRRGNAHREGDGRTAAAVAEGFEAQPVDGPSARAPGSLRILQHSDRSAHIEFALRIEVCNCRRHIDAGAVRADQELQAVADFLLEFARERGVAAAVAGI
jgi:hypothetical protein